MGFVYGCIAISLICGAFVLLVLLCRRMLRKAPSYWRVTAWLLIMLRLAVPVVTTSSISVLSLIFDNKPEIESTILNYYPIDELSVSEQLDQYDNITLPAGTGLTDIAEQSVKPIELNPEFVALSVWGTGAAIVLLSFFLTSIRFRKYSSITPCDDSRINGIIAEECKNKNVRCSAFWVSRSCTFALYGLFRPRILISRDMAHCTDAQLRFAIQHEIAHIKRKDILFLRLLMLVQAIHWFNPLIWLMGKYVREDIELCADADAIRDIPVYTRLDYGRALIDMCAQANAKYSPTTAMFGSSINLRNRVAMIANFQPKRYFINFILALTMTLTIVSFTTMPSPVKAAETENGHTESSGALDDTSFEFKLKNLYLGAISDQGDIKYNYDMDYIMQNMDDFTVLSKSGMGSRLKVYQEHMFSASYPGNGLLFSVETDYVEHVSSYFTKPTANAKAMTKPININPADVTSWDKETLMSISSAYERYCIYSGPLQSSGESVNTVVKDFIFIFDGNYILKVSYGKALINLPSASDGTLWFDKMSSKHISGIIDEAAMIDWLAEIAPPSFSYIYNGLYGRCIKFGEIEFLVY
jgi:beta-lactamase regulating signal transducer with metallopeptidase domain